MAWLIHQRRVLLPGGAVKVQERTRGPGGRGVSGGADAAGAARSGVEVVRGARWASALRRGVGAPVALPERAVLAPSPGSGEE